MEPVQERRTAKRGHGSNAKQLQHTVLALDRNLWGQIVEMLMSLADAMAPRRQATAFSRYRANDEAIVVHIAARCPPQARCDARPHFRR